MTTSRLFAARKGEDPEPLKLNSLGRARISLHSIRGRVIVSRGLRVLAGGRLVCRLAGFCLSFQDRVGFPPGGQCRRGCKTEPRPCALKSNFFFAGAYIQLIAKGRKKRDPRTYFARCEATGGVSTLPSLIRMFFGPGERSPDPPLCYFTYHE